MGYDPFVDVAGTDTIVVRIHRAGSGLEGTIELRGPPQQAHSRAATILSKSGDCAELSAALAVGIAIAIDPLSITREPPAPPSVASAARLPPNPPPPALPRTAAPERPAEPIGHVPIRVQLGLAPSIATGALPTASFGVRTLAGISRGSWEIDVEGRFDPPVSVQAQGGSIQASLVLGTVAPCVRYWLAIACGQVSFGALRGTGLGFDHTREEDTFYAAAGVRTGLEFPLGAGFALRVSAEAQVPLRPTRLEADGQPIWSTPPFEFAAVPMLLGRFP